MNYGTNPSRVTLSLIAGALTGAALIALWYLWGTARNLGVRYVLDYGLLSTTTVFTVALVVWAVGLTIFGLPLWWLLHRLRIRHWWAAGIVGAVLTFLVDFGIETRLFELIPPPSNSTYFATDSGGLTVIANHLTAHGWWVAVQAALMLSVSGVLIAVLIWRIAYRRDETLTRLLIKSS